LHHIDTISHGKSKQNKIFLDGSLRQIPIIDKINRDENNTGSIFKDLPAIAAKADGTVDPILLGDIFFDKKN
jgi:hypothetical protein